MVMMISMEPAGIGIDKEEGCRTFCIRHDDVKQDNMAHDLDGTTRSTGETAYTAWRDSVCNINTAAMSKAARYQQSAIWN